MQGDGGGLTFFDNSFASSRGRMILAQYISWLITGNVRNIGNENGNWPNFGIGSGN